MGSCFLSCDKEPMIEDYMLDGDVVFDPSTIQKSFGFRKVPKPTAADLDRHIIIAHGFTATNE
jgi:hypothetical protein